MAYVFYFYLDISQNSTTFTDRSVGKSSTAIFMSLKQTKIDGFLLQCWEVFHLNGYHHTSMQDLANATGLQKAGLYHHFPTKQALMDRVIEFARAQFRSYVLSVADDLSIPPEQRLEKMLRRNKRLATLHRRGCFFANIALETGREALFNDILHDTLLEWKQCLTKIMEAFFPTAEAEIKAQRLIMEYEGAVLFYKISGDENYLEDFVNRSVQALGFTSHKLHSIRPAINLSMHQAG
jgi:TetR/AcrR family transcriptional repressor of nem operon